jgi:hypothetical protein
MFTCWLMLLRIFGFLSLQAALPYSEGQAVNIRLDSKSKYQSVKSRRVFEAD